MASPAVSFLVVLLLLLCSCSSLAPSSGDSYFYRGVNFTAERRAGYASESAREIAGLFPDYGINAIALVPYGFNRLGSTEVRFGGSRIWETDQSIKAIGALAHRLGMKVMLKPQIWVPRSFPGHVDFDSEEEREEWFANYIRFVEHYARLATAIHADIFCVGVEFSKLVRYEENWRALIARTRELYDGPLVYAANWGEEFETLAFWDALDYIGLNQYYPLPDDLSTGHVVEKVEAVHRRFRRPVIFTEAGFASLENPHREPWDETPRALSPEDQARAYEAVFQAFYHQPWLHGVFWWKIGTNGFGGLEDGSHTPWRKPAMEVMARWYFQGGR